MHNAKLKNGLQNLFRCPLQNILVLKQIYEINQIIQIKDVTILGILQKSLLMFWKVKSCTVITCKYVLDFFEVFLLFNVGLLHFCHLILTVNNNKIIIIWIYKYQQAHLLGVPSGVPSILILVCYILSSYPYYNNNK